MQNKRYSHFGEKVMYRPKQKQGDRLNNREPRFEEGIWTGMSETGPEVIIATPNGTRRSRTVKGPEDERYDLETLNKIDEEPTPEWKDENKVEKDKDPDREAGPGARKGAESEIREDKEEIKPDYRAWGITK